MFYLFTFLTIIKCQITSTFTIEKINKTESHLLSFAEIPSLDLDYKEEERTTTELCLGTPPQCFKLIIQTNSFYIWVSDGDSKVQKSVNKFHTKNSSTLSLGVLFIVFVHPTSRNRPRKTNNIFLIFMISLLPLISWMEI